MALPAQRTNLATNPGMEAASGTVNIRTNLTKNPAIGVDTTDVVATAGGGTPTLSRVATGGPAEAATFARAAVATAGWTYVDLRQSGSATNLVTAGTTYTSSAILRSNVSGPVTAYIQWIDSGGAVLSTTTATLANNTLNTWERFSVSAVAPTGAVRTANIFRVNATTTTTTTMDATAFLLEASVTLGTYFDGATAAAGDFTYAWSGTANASTSYQRGVTVTSYVGVSGVAFSSSAWASSGGKSIRITSTATATGLSFAYVTSTLFSLLQPGKTYTVSAKARLSAPLAGVSTRTILMTQNGTGNPTVLQSAAFPNVAGVHDVSLTFTTNSDATTGTLRLYNGASQGNGDVWWDNLLIEETATLGTYFDGSTVETGWLHAWTGAANASTSTRNVTGLWVDVIETGTAHTQLTVLGMGATPSTTKITRNDGRENWPVPGWLGRNTIDADTGTDWATPLGRPLTYTLFKDGIPFNTRTVTVPATAGDIMDPLSPGAAMKINTANTDPNTLTLSTDALRGAVHKNTQSDREYPMGGRYPIARTGVRASVQDVPVVLNAHRNTASDALLRMVEQAPVLLIRTLPSWGDLPSLIYTDGDVSEAPFNRGRGGQFTQWQVDGNTIAPVTRAATDGRVKHDDVKANLAGRTHDSIKASSGTKRHVEIKANPLGLGQ